MKKQSLSKEKGRQAARSPCPVSRTLDILGDKWTLLVVRDLFLGKQTYGELLDSPERIPTNILADRLKRLTAHGMVTKQPYQQRPPRYRYQLTEKGQALAAALRAIIDWGLAWLPGTRLPPGLDGEK